MKSNSKGTPAYLVNGANLFPKAPFSPQINPTPQSHSISRINQNSIDSPSYYDPKPSNGMTFGFGLQVLKIPTQSRERTMVKPITYSSLQPNKKPPMPKLPPSANKLQREDTVEVIDQGQGRLGFKEMPNIKLAKLPKLPQISKVLDDEKPKAYSQNDISTRSRRNTKNKLEKLSLTSNKKKDERNVESFHSMYGVGTDTKREIEGLVKVQELDDPVEVKPIEIRSLNIVQKKLTYNRDSWFDLKDVKGPPRRESALGSYLSKALSEVSANVANGAVTQAISPRDNFGLEIKGQKREKDQVKEKVDRRGKVRRESEASRDAIPVQEQGTGEEQYKSEAKGIESGRVGEVKRSLRRPNSKVGKDREKKKKEKVEVKKEKEEDDSKIEEYRFEVHSDEDLSLDEYLKAKKENQENNETEEMEYDFLSKQEL